MGYLHDLANVQQTSSKCIHNTRANAGRLLEVCLTYAGSCKHSITYINVGYLGLIVAKATPNICRRSKLVHITRVRV